MAFYCRGGKEGLEDLEGVEGGSVVVNRVQGGRDCQVTAYEGVGEGGGKIKNGHIRNGHG